MARALPFCLTLLATAAVAGGQTRPPAFLDDAAPSARLDTAHLQAQADGPIRIGADGRGVVTIIVAPKTKMHVYAADVDGYVPFTVKIEPAPAVTPGKVTYPAAETYVFPPTGESSRVYLKPFKVTHTFVLTAEARRTLATRGSLPGVASLRYQACDDTVCYRPTTGQVAFEVVR